MQSSSLKLSEINKKNERGKTMVKGWKCILSMVLVMTLVSAGPLTVVHAEDLTGAIAATNENQPIFSKIMELILPLDILFQILVAHQDHKFIGFFL